MATQDDHVITPPRRRRAGTWGEHPHIQESDISSDYQADSEFFTVDKRHLQRLEAKLSHVEDVLAEILEALEKKGHVTLKSQSTDCVVSRTSYV